MSYRFPPKGTREAGFRIVARGSGSAQAQAFEETRVLRFCADGFLAEPDFVAAWCDPADTALKGGWWNKLLGAVVVLGVSGGFWTGVGLLISRLVR